ncbi:MAG: Crp/Fnr family transcriptional regulator, partial [Bacteroidota bacterium]
MIPKEILEQYRPTTISLPSDTFLFLEGEKAHFYFQIVSGKVKMININSEGKEFVQGTFGEGQSFGEPPLFHDALYPASAKTDEHSQLYKLSKDKLLSLLHDHPDIHLKFTATLSKRLMYKAMIMKEISSHDAQHRILTFLDYLKKEYGNQQESFQVDLTRQEISNLLGIRVETVIRTVKQLSQNGEIELKGRSTPTHLARRVADIGTFRKVALSQHLVLDVSPSIHHASLQG